MPITIENTRLASLRDSSRQLHIWFSKIICPRNKKPPSSIEVWYLLILTDLELPSSELWGAVSACCYPACFPSAFAVSGNSHPALCTEELLSTLCVPHLHQDLYLPSLTFTHTCKLPDQAVSHAKNTNFISSQLHFGAVGGFHPSSDCPLHNLISPAPVPLTALCWVQQMNEPPRTFGDLK